MSVTEQDLVTGRERTRPWWVFLITGFIWFFVSFLVLSFDPTSAATIGYLTGFVLLAAGVNEFVVLALVDGWKWAHGLLGVLFIVAGVMAILAPFQTFGILALLIGWYLLFKGIFSIIFSIVFRDQMYLWGLLLFTGILEVVVGVWAIGYPGRSAALLILWVGIGALLRGITEIVVAFQIKSDPSAFATA